MEALQASPTPLAMPAWLAAQKRPPPRARVVNGRAAKALPLARESRQSILFGVVGVILFITLCGALTGLHRAASEASSATSISSAAGGSPATGLTPGVRASCAGGTLQIAAIVPAGSPGFACSTAANTLKAGAQAPPAALQHQGTCGTTAGASHGAVTAWVGALSAAHTLSSVYPVTVECPQAS